MKNIFLLLLGVFLKIISRFIAPKKDIYVLGSQNGEAFIDNSKYMFMFLLNKDIRPIWLTRNKKVTDVVKGLGGEAYHNLSLRGLYFSLRCKVYCFSTTRSDALFIFPRKDREIINLWHGMPIKKIVYDYNKKEELTGNPLKSYLWEQFVVGFENKDIDFTISTSQYFENILKSAFRNENIYTTGQPRNDVFYQGNADAIKRKYNLNSKFIVTYMPTHRSYGKGELNPIIFNNDDAALNYFRKNDIEVIIKFHKNMRGVYKKTEMKSPLVDFSFQDIDPQELLFITDILITDFSSCYIDYLLLNRPIIFYHYDNYEENDNDVYFNIKDSNPGIIVKKEAELFEEIKKCHLGNDESRGKREQYNNIYNKFNDGRNSERVFNKINEMID